MRDNTLAISGLLVPTIGGPSVKPLQPAGYYRHLNFPQRTYEPDKGEALWRRGSMSTGKDNFSTPCSRPLMPQAGRNVPLSAPSPTPLSLPLFCSTTQPFLKQPSPLPKNYQRGWFLCRRALSYAFQHAVSRPPDDIRRENLSRFTGD